MALSTLGQQKASLSHKRVIYAICGKYLGMFVDVLITFFMFAIAVVMLAGAGALLEQLAGIPKLWGSVAVTVLTVIIVCLDVKKVIGFIGSVTPLLAIIDRKSVVEGKSVSVRVDLGGRRIIKKKIYKKEHT